MLKCIKSVSPVNINLEASPRNVRRLRCVRCSIAQTRLSPFYICTTETAAAYHDTEPDDEYPREKKEHSIPIIRKPEEWQYGDESAGEHDERVECHRREYSMQSFQLYGVHF